MDRKTPRKYFPLSAVLMDPGLLYFGRYIYTLLHLDSCMCLTSEPAVFIKWLFVYCSRHVPALCGLVGMFLAGGASSGTSQQL